MLLAAPFWQEHATQSMMLPCQLLHSSSSPAKSDADPDECQYANTTEQCQEIGLLSLKPQCASRQLKCLSLKVPTMAKELQNQVQGSGEARSDLTF